MPFLNIYMKPLTNVQRLDLKHFPVRSNPHIISDIIYPANYVQV